MKDDAELEQKLRHLKEKPFQDNQFTSVMQEKVRREAGEKGARNPRSARGRFFGWGLGAAGLLAAALLLTVFWPDLAVKPPEGMTMTQGGGAEQGGTAPGASAVPTAAARPADETRSADEARPADETSPADKGVELPATADYQRMILQGTVSFVSSGEGGQISLPLYSIEASYGVDIKGDGTDPSVTPVTPLSAVDFAIMPDQAEGLAAYWMNDGDDKHGYLLIAPRGWRSTDSGVGANASYGFHLRNPDNPRERLDYMDTAGSCGGCAIYSIGQYFPELAGWSAEKGMEVYEKLDFVTQEQDGDYSRYSYLHPETGVLTEGMARKEIDETEPLYRFKKEELSLEDAGGGEPLAETILGFFKAQGGAVETGRRP
ncbi:DUF4850 domain-containing protein [Paenibacillus sp. CN-4]|uniref:DUF4850 domain-containing protein n=1 Tax=Paenibacillus nanchangensis TaxID=3348343 RepID=UPI003979B2E8